MFPMDQNDAEEYQKKLQLAQHEIRMRHDRFVDELSKEALVTFNEILNTIIVSDEGIGYAHYMVGQSNAVLRLKHKTCPCGGDHDSTGHEAIKKTQAEMGFSGDEGDAAPAKHGMDPQVVARLMDEYMLKPNNKNTFECTGCGMEYQSLDDRMLRQPGIDGCSGCKIKSAHG